MIDQILTRSAAHVVQSRRRADRAAAQVVGAASPDGLAEFTLEASAARKAFKASAAVFSAAQGLQRRLVDLYA